MQRTFEKAYSTWYSQAVSHPSTNQARPCLASEIGRDRALPGWDGRRRCVLLLRPSSRLHTTDTTRHTTGKVPPQPPTKGASQRNPRLPAPHHPTLHPGSTLTTAYDIPQHPPEPSQRDTTALATLQRPSSRHRTRPHTHTHTHTRAHAHAHKHTHASLPGQTYSNTDRPPPQHHHGPPSWCAWSIPLYWTTTGSLGLSHPAVNGLQQPARTRSLSQIQSGYCVCDGT